MHILISMNEKNIVCDKKRTFLGPNDEESMIGKLNIHLKSNILLYNYL